MTKQIRIYLFLFLATLLAGLPAYGQVGSGIITMTTSKNVGEQIRLDIMADGDITIEGVKGKAIKDYNFYTIENQQIVIRGNVTTLSCDNNQLTALDVSKNTALTDLYCSDNQLTALDVSKNTALIALYCNNNQLTALDVSHNTNTAELSCANNQLTALDISQNTAIHELYCDNNQLTALDVSQNTSLTRLYCFNNQLKALDVSQNTALTELYCERNQLTALYVSKNTALTRVTCSGNRIKGEEMTRLVNSLPDRTGKYAGSFTVVEESVLEGNICFKSDVAIAKGKNWKTFKRNYTGTGSDYEGHVNMVTFTTAKAIGEKITLEMRYTGNSPTLSGATGTPMSGESVTYTLTSQTVTITGDITYLDCSSNQLTALEVCKNTALTELVCFSNQIKGKEMTRLVYSLPDRMGMDAGGFAVVQEPSPEGNRCLKKDVAIAKGKNWNTLKYKSETHKYVAYEGDHNVITFTTAKAVGENITLYMEYSDAAPTLSGATGTPKDREEVTYTLTSQTVTIRGDVTVLYCNGNQLTTLDISKNTALTLLDCSDNQLTALDLSKNTELTYLYCERNQLTALDVSKNTELSALSCFGNQIKGGEMTRLVNSLPDYPYYAWRSGGRFTVVQEPALEGNICLKSDVAIAKGKNWNTYKYNSDKYYIAYKGAEEAQLLKVRLKKEGEGTLTATGATNLYAVPLGTELTIEATPAEGYELKALTANGTNILATKKFTVTADTEVKATFTKKTLAVTLTKEGEGMLKATCADNLNAVEYGTELTIDATPAEGYTLVALTANGDDILATKKFVVKATTEVKATFAKKTFEVTLTHEGEGTLNATGADNLNAVEYGTELTIDATPAEGYTLVALTANGADILATKKFIVKATTEVKATFAKKTFTVTLTKEGEGTLNATGADNLNAVEYGTELTIDATPAEGYTLVALTANGADILATKKVVVKEATEVKATFAKKTFAVTLTKEGEGTLNATGADNLNAVKIDTELTIEATPAEGYYLMALTANGTDILATRKVVVKEAMEVKATFAKKTFAVTLTNEGEGMLNATGADNLNAVAYGTELTIEATPAAGYELKALTANGADILATKKVVVKEATEVKATFAKKTFAVTLTKEAGEGTLNATGADDLNAVPFDTELTIDATPAEGYELTALTANGTDILATKKVVVKEATEIKAIFAKKTFSVTLTKEGEGTLNATGVDNLNAVAYGTELTIDATPAEGYTLVALTANGADILASKKVVVKEDTEVKAIFTKKTFAVELTQEGEGLLNATGADDLNAVPYGTELTIEATPAEGYELKALTANGNDILATKQFVVKGATEIKATFTKKTAADRVEAGSVRLYPNPASTYVNVKATKADALVRLYDANGTLLYEARTDDHGLLQIELSAYAEGTYLLLVDGNAQRLLIQR